ncbi:unnamed protein product [Penicillium olsonii]|nr:unnamed protein product [Penicillium olsonii]
MDSTISPLSLLTMSAQRPLMDCIKPCPTASPLAHILLTTGFDHEFSLIHPPSHYADFIAQSITMAISHQKRINRISKPCAARRKLWTEALKEKLVQYAAKRQRLCIHFANGSKSRRNEALQEALYCTKSTEQATTINQMRKDIAQGVYIVTQYPPYFADKAAPIEEISPLDTCSIQPQTLTFWSDITYSQQRRYFKMVDAIIRHFEKETGQVASETMVLYAHYQMDTHIRRHIMRTESMLTMCRDKEDVIELRHWQWETAASDNTTHTQPFDPDWGVGWVMDPTNSLDQQYEEWKAGQSERERRLQDVRWLWARIQHERREQRKRTAVFSFRGVPFRTIRYDPPSEAPLTEEEITEIARSNGHIKALEELWGEAEC